jgi:hypothetical protein
MKKYIKYKYKYNLLKKYVGGANENKMTHGEQGEFEQSLVNFIIQELNTLKQNPDLKFITIHGNKVSIDNGKWTWDAIKNKGDEILKLLFKFRKSLVDTLLIRIKTYFNCNPTTEECYVSASGSVGEMANLKSDYDLSLVIKDYNTSKAIQIFNSVILKVFNDAPFIVFDTNLYGYSPMIPKNSRLIKDDTKLWDNNYNIAYYYLLYGKNKDQDNWAVRRLYTFISNVTEMKKLIDCDIVEEYCVNYPLGGNMETNYLAYMSQFETECQEVNVTECNKADRKNKLMNILSNMNYYGDETYFSVGAFLHVVGTMFYLKDSNYKSIICQPQQLIHSMIENLAYFIHSYSKSNDIIIAIKYMARFMDAYVQLTIYNNNNNQIYCSLIDVPTNLIKLMTDIKNRVRNATNESINEYYVENNYPKTNDKEIQIDNIRNRLNTMLLSILNTNVLNTDVYDITYYTKLLLKLLSQTLDTEYTFINITIKDDKYVFNIV